MGNPGAASTARPGAGAGLRRRHIPAWALVVLFVVMPLVEIFVLIQVGQVIGPWWTILLLIVDSVIGGWLVRREGARAWKALTTALRSGAMPARELADASLILIGGTLMLSPGFVTDAFGVLMIVPFTRPFARRLLTRVVARRLAAPYVAGPYVSGSTNAQRPPQGPGGPVVKGEVID